MILLQQGKQIYKNINNNINNETDTWTKNMLDSTIDDSSIKNVGEDEIITEKENNSFFIEESEELVNFYEFIGLIYFYDEVCMLEEFKKILLCMKKKMKKKMKRKMKRKMKKI